MAFADMRLHERLAAHEIRLTVALSHIGGWEALIRCCQTTEVRNGIRVRAHFIGEGTNHAIWDLPQWIDSRRGFARWLRHSRLELRRRRRRHRRDRRLGRDGRHQRCFFRSEGRIRAAPVARPAVDASAGKGGSSGSGGSAGVSGSGGTGGSAGSDGGPRDGASGATGGTAGKGGTGGNGGTAGAAGSGGQGGTDGGGTDVSVDGGGGAAGTGGGGGTDGGGGADGSGGASPDASGDTVTDSEAGTGDGGDGGDGGSVCTVDNTACSNGGSNGLCKSQVCAACADGPGNDDSNCATAYAGAYLCLSGACTPGNCRINGDCATSVVGPLCGITQPNFCGKCTTDAQCLAASPTTPVCNTGPGLCIASAGSCTGTPDNTACPINGADVCCGSACTPGECCPGSAGDTVCKAKLSNNSAVCSAGHQCTVCDPVAGLTFLVDPLSGVDGGATGSGTSGGGTPNAACAFKTITRALQAIGSNPAVGTVIQVRNSGPVSVAGNGETFPINVTTNVTITAVGGLVTITPPAAQAAFGFASAGSGINGTLGGGSLIIDGGGNTASFGVVATTGSTTATSLRNVTIQNFLQGGVRVANAGVLTIQQGVAVTGNGTVAVGARRPGLHVTGSAHVDITVPMGQPTTSFNLNTQHGILVDGTASVTITGSQSGGTGTIECRGNAVAGLAIAQTPGNNLPLNAVTGFLSVGTTQGNGIRIEGGSNVRMRDSYSLGNFGSGIIVATSVIATVRNNSLTNIDLGSRLDAGGSPGGNTFQASIGSNANGGAGICLQDGQQLGHAIGPREHVLGWQELRDHRRLSHVQQRELRRQS